MIKISTSILSSTNRPDSINKLNKTTTDYIHIDVMDNIFVPNYQFPIEEINKLITKSEKKVDIHLMTNDPEYYIDRINQNNNISNITIHLEIDKDIAYLTKKIKNLGYKVGLAIKPQTSIELLKEYIENIDQILVMSVEPGFGGQKFIEETPRRIKDIKKLNNNITIEVDGGINEKTIDKIKDISNIAVVGSYIINNDDYQKAINNLKNGSLSNSGYNPK